MGHRWIEHRKYYDETKVCADCGAEWSAEIERDGMAPTNVSVGTPGRRITLARLQEAALFFEKAKEHRWGRNTKMLSKPPRRKA